MNKMKFGSYIKESRIRKKYTQQDLADLLFVDVTTVSKWERGISYPDITLVPDICRVLEISEHELIASSHDIEYRKMKKDAKKYNNMKKVVFITLNICYLLALLTCFIVNIAVNHTLSWFYIVLTSIMCAYTFIPTITWIFNTNKKLVFIGSTYLSLFLLFLTCSVYTSNYWFLIPTIGVLIGYFIVFYPILFLAQKHYLDEEKYKKLLKWFLFTYLMGMFILVNILLISIYLYIPFNIKLALLINGGCFMIPILFGILNIFEFGRTITKPLLLGLGIVLIILIGFGITRAIYLKNSQETKNYVVKEEYQDINIIVKNMDINVHLVNDDQNKIMYVENEKMTVDVKVNGGVLTISENDSRKFYDKLFDFSSFKIELYLTQEMIGKLNIKSNTGDIDIDKGFTFDSIDINNSTGDIDIESNVLNDININNSTGDVEIENSNIDGVLNIQTSTGDIELSRVHCSNLNIKVSTGDTELKDVLVDADFNMNGSTGDLIFDGFDAANIYVVAKTGNVKGTILTNKIFMVKSETGRVDVPETISGGICKITLSTGNIIISYK